MLRHITTRVAGLIILIAGLWGGLIPFIGPYFHFTLGPDHAWTWTTGRLWLVVLPAAASVFGGLVLMGGGPRISGRLGALIALAGAVLAQVLNWNARTSITIAARQVPALIAPYDTSAAHLQEARALLQRRFADLGVVVRMFTMSSPHLRGQERPPLLGRTLPMDPRGARSAILAYVAMNVRPQHVAARHGDIMLVFDPDRFSRFLSYKLLRSFGSRVY